MQSNQRAARVLRRSFCARVGKFEEKLPIVKSKKSDSG